MGLGAMVSSVGIRKMGARTFPRRWSSGDRLCPAKVCEREELRMETLYHYSLQGKGEAEEPEKVNEEEDMEKERQSREETQVGSGGEDKT